MTETTALTEAQQETALNIVAEWMGRKGFGANDETPCSECGDTLDCVDRPYADRVRPAPTGRDAAHSAFGPMLVPDFDWTGTPTPTVILEGGPDDWAIRVADEARDEFSAAGIYAEPYASYALNLYPA